MRLFRRSLVMTIAGVLVFGAVRAAEWPLPPLAGEVGGKALLLLPEGGPPLAWRLTLVPGPSGRQRIALHGEGGGTRVRGEVDAAADGSASWRLLEGEADLEPWAPALAARLGFAVEELAIKGTVRFRGEGAWRGGRLGGQFQLSVSDARVEFPSQKLSLEGLELEFVVEDLTEFRSAPAQRISWTKGNYDTLELGAGRIMFTVTGKQVQVDEGVVAMLGGEVMVAAFTFSLLKPDMVFITRATGLDLPEILPFLPPFFAVADGEVDGTMMLRWAPGSFEFGAATLSLRSGRKAELRLLPRPGLISERLPAGIMERVPNLKKIETGEATLKAERFDVSFTPEGDQEGRTAVVRIYAEPVDPTYRAPIDLTVNLRGPIESLVKLGTNPRVRMGGNR